MRAESRDRLFWLVCIPLRGALSCHALTGERQWLRAFAAVVGARWVLGYEVGDEGMFGGPTWWKEERRLHGVLWLAYALGLRPALALDTAFGAYNWVTTPIFSSYTTDAVQRPGAATGVHEGVARHTPG